MHTDQKSTPWLFAAVVLGTCALQAAGQTTPLLDMLKGREADLQVTTNPEGIQIAGRSAGYVSTEKSYAVPVRVDFVARSSSSSIRLRYGRGSVILNWEDNQNSLRYRDPAAGQLTAVAGRGRIPTNEWVEITWIIDERESRLLVNGQQRASVAGSNAGVSSAIGIGIGPGPNSMVAVKSIRVRSGAIDDQGIAGPSVAAQPGSPTGASAKPVYSAPDLAAPIFDPKKLRLNMPQRTEIADLLTGHVSTRLNLSQGDGLALASRMLGIALRADPEHRVAVLLNAQLRRGETPAAPSSQPAGAVTMAPRLVALAQACQATNNADDRILAGYLYALVLAVDPRNEEATFQTERLAQAGVRVAWDWAGGARSAVASASPSVPSGDPNQPRPILRRQSSIKGLAVEMAPNGHLIGLSSDVIATVLPGDNRTNGARFVRDAGDDMRTALAEAIRVVQVRYPKWQNGDIQISFEDKYSKQDGGSAGAAFALLLLSVFDGFEIDPQVAITGDITVDSKVRKVGGVDAKLRAASAGGAKTVLIPEENIPGVEDYLVLNGVKGVWEIQILSMATLDDAVRAVRTDRESDLSQAMKLFGEVQAELVKSSAAYLNGAAAKEKLDQVLKLAPNHLSAKYLRLAADRRQPTKLSLSMSLYRAFLAVYPIRDIVWGGEAPSPGTLSASIAGGVRRELQELRRICDDRAGTLVNALQAVVDAALQASTPAGAQTLNTRRAAVITELERLQTKRETLEELMRKGV